MKPFNNVIVSATEPEQKSDVWIQHAENIFDKNKANFINGYFNEESTSIATSSVSKCLYLEIEGNKEYCITKKASARFNVGTTSEVPNVGVNLIDNAKNVTTANTQKNASQIILKASVSAKYMIIWYYASNDDTLSENEILDSIIIKENIQDDILVNDNGVYNSVLNRKNAISLGIKEQVNITQQGLRILVPMDNLSVKVGETFELLSDGTIKILKNTIIFAFAQTQLIINDTDTGRLYIEKNGDGICAEEGKGTKAYQAMGIFNVNVGDIIRVTVVNVTAGRGNTGTTVSFNHLDMYEI